MDKIYNIIINRHCKRDIQFKYILNCVSMANDFMMFACDKERMEVIADSYHDYMTATDTKYKNTQVSIAGWLATCPSVIEIDHDDFTVRNIGKAWGYCKTEHAADRFVESWYEKLAMRIIQMCKILNVEL